MIVLKEEGNMLAILDINDHFYNIYSKSVTNTFSDHA